MKSVLSRVQFSGMIVCVMVCWLITLHASAGGPGGALVNEKPNIIFIMADDFGYGSLGCYGQTKYETPNIDRLASAGTRFTQAYAGGPVCTASRSVLMTGLHNGHTAARDNIPHYETYLQAGDITVAKVLHDAGYTCGGVGKWSLGDAGTAGSATNQGFDMWFGYLNQDHAHYYYPEYLDDSYRIENNGRYELPGNTESREFYSHQLMVERSMQFIRDSHDKPFFLYAAFTLPHFSAPEEDEDGLSVPSTGSYSNRDWSQKAKKYAAMVNMLDQDVGRMLDLLDKLGLADNTLVIFTSDNGGTKAVWDGFNTNGPLRGYKAEVTEGGIRVPFIARWPGKVPAGKSSDEIISFQDILPTFAEIAGVPSPKNIDGISIVPVLQGQKNPLQHPYLYWDYGHCRKRYDQAVRLGKWKGIRLGQQGKIALYDLERDLGEEKNLADSHADVVAKIEGIMKAAVTPSERYPVGQLYKGGPIWKKTTVAK